MELTVTLDFWWRHMSAGIFVSAEWVVFAICLESRPRRTSEEQRTDGLAAAHVGPRIKARITDQPDAIKYTGDTTVKTYPRYFTKYRSKRSFLFAPDIISYEKKCGSRDLTTDVSFKYFRISCGRIIRNSKLLRNNIRISFIK